MNSAFDRCSARSAEVTLEVGTTPCLQPHAATRIRSSRRSQIFGLPPGAAWTIGPYGPNVTFMLTMFGPVSASATVVLVPLNVATHSAPSGVVPVGGPSSSV